MSNAWCIDWIAVNVRWLREKLGKYPDEIGMPNPPVPSFSVVAMPEHVHDFREQDLSFAPHTHEIRISEYVGTRGCWAYRFGQGAPHEFFPVRAP